MTDINPGGPLSPDKLDDFEAQDEAVLNLLRTRPGERVYRPDYGTGFRRYLHMPATLATEALIRQEGILSVQTHEPDINLDVSESEVRLLEDGKSYEIDLVIETRKLTEVITKERRRR